MRDVRNYWGGSPLGGLNKNAMQDRVPSAYNLNAYLAPLPVHRVRQDPQTWKEALQEAEIPLPLLSYRVKLQQLFNDVWLDGHVSACLDRRRDQVLLKDFMICNANGKEDEVLTYQIKKWWFYDIMYHGIESKWFGYSLIGLGNIIDGDFEKIDLIRRGNVSPDRLNLAPVPYSPNGIEFRNKEAKDSAGNNYFDWILWCPTPSDFGISPCGYGLLYKVGIYQILLRNNLGDNATYNELFGQPMRIGRTDKKGLESRNKLMSMLEMLGSSGRAVLDKEDLIEFHESTSGSGAANGTYDNLEQRMQKMISKVILGHADALDSTPGKLGAGGNGDDAQGRALRDKETHDTMFLENFINGEVLPKLNNLGMIRIPVGKKFAFKNNKEVDAIEAKKGEKRKRVAEFVKTMSDSGLQPDIKWIEQETEVKMSPKTEPASLIKNPNIPDKVKNKLENLYK